MTPKRTVVVAVAVAVGVLASVLSYIFLNGAQQRAYHNAKLVPAYVVAKPIPRMLTWTDAVNGGYVQKKSVPAEFRPTAAVTSLAALQGKEADAPFSVGQVVVTSMFVSPIAAANTFSQIIPAGNVAVTVSVDQVHGVAGLPVPGDKVDLLISVNNTESPLLQNVPILAIGQSTTANTNTNAQNATQTAATTANPSSGLFTFAVSPSDAARIALAEQQAMGIYMLLVPPGNPVVSIPAVTPDGILSGPQTSS
ncbi:MAG TPA: Flp pilus assembly protein CpaB [Acidimicrobiales bacterium]|nr:Flp pilus assembly protein CpaB [Acidimicrobiales bacterium]